MDSDTAFLLHPFTVVSVGIPTWVYWGTWNQNAGADHLVLDYYEGTTHAATFDGYAVGDDCSEGGPGRLPSIRTSSKA